MTTLPPSLGRLRLLREMQQAQMKSPDGVGASANFGAGNETRTRDPNLGKVVLYQLSYSRAKSQQF